MWNARNIGERSVLSTGRPPRVTAADPRHRTATEEDPALRKRWLRSTVFGMALALPGAAAALEPVDQTWRGIAIEGTDPVAYFTDGKAVPGKAEFEFDWNGAKWRFASAAHRDQFRADPERYAPQYGGYCAWAVGHDRTAKIDPDAWTIVGDKLYLNYDKSVQQQWLPEKERWIDAADRNWPGLRDAR